MTLFKEEKLIEKTIDSKEVFSGKLLHIFCDKVQLPNGKVSIREYLAHPGAVAIVAIDEEKRVIMERQFRYAFKKEIFEIPAGKLEKGEDPIIAAKRELKEETGIEAKEFTFIGDFYPSVGYSDEIIHLYLATSLDFGDRKLDDDEFLNLEFVDFDEVIKQIIEGKIADGKTIAAILKVKQLLGK